MGTRRDFFRDAAALTGGPKMLSALLASIERASAIDPPEGSTFLDAEHVVILMQENRSFDHAFGTLRGVRGFNDPRAITLPDGNPVWVQTNAAGETYAPFRLDIKDTRATWMGSLPHSWPDQVDARNDGKHDRWLDAKRSGHEDCADMPLTLGYYNREDIPFYYALADAFTICDQHFCSSLTGTTPNRLHLWTGTIREKPDAASAPHVRNSDVDYGATSELEDLSRAAGGSGRLLADLSERSERGFGLGRRGGRVARELQRQPARMVRAIQRRVSQTSQGVCGTGGGYAAGGNREAAGNRRLSQGDQEEGRAAAVCPLGAGPLDPGGGRAAFGARTESPRQGVHHQPGDPDYRQLATLRYRDAGVEREMAIPKGDLLHQFRKDVETRQAADRLVAGAARAFLRPSRLGLVRRVVHRRSAEHPDQQSGRLEERRSSFSPTTRTTATSTTCRRSSRPIRNAGNG